MINYNLIMYMGIAFYILVMIGFIILITTKTGRKKDGYLGKKFKLLLLKRYLTAKTEFFR